MSGRGRGRSGRVRIIGGAWRGRRLAVGPGEALRPTPDRVRETLFNWLREHVDGARCVDLFAGTGALGLEALSRGAAEVWFVERDRRLADALSAEVERLGAKARVIVRDGRAFVGGAPAETFDIVFADPPYRYPIDALLPGLLGLLRRGGLAYVERAADDGLPEAAGAEWIRRARAGSVEFGLLERR